MDNRNDTNDDYYTTAEVLDLLCITRPTLYRRIAGGEVPPPARRGRPNGWRRHDIDSLAIDYPRIDDLRQRFPATYPANSVEIADALGVQARTIGRRWAHSGKMPEPVRGAYPTLWRWGDIIAAIEAGSLPVRLCPDGTVRARSRRDTVPPGLVSASMMADAAGLTRSGWESRRRRGVVPKPVRRIDGRLYWSEQQRDEMQRGVARPQPLVYC